MSSPFDYLTVLTSIVIGLAITNVLMRLANVITARTRVDFYWPPVAWAIWLFFVCVQHWWAQWSIRHQATWSFGVFWLVLLTPVDLFLLSALVLPGPEADGKLDLGEWYFHNRMWFYGLLLFLPVLAIVEELARSGRIYSMLNLAFLLAFVVVSILGMILPSRRAQAWIAGQTLVMTLVYVGLLFLQLPG